MRTLAIGDIHGCLRSFDGLLETVRPRPDDLLVLLGDVIDRGPDTCGVMDRIIGLASSNRLVVLRGNHEEMLLDAIRDPGPYRDMWLRFGGDAALLSYPDGNINPAHIAFLQDHCVDWYETSSHIFVHAGLQQHVPMHKQLRQFLFWATFNPPPTHISGKRIICGHSIQQSRRPVRAGQAICIDTGSGMNGTWLTCLDCDSLEYWQANEAGHTRRGTISATRSAPPPSES